MVDPLVVADALEAAADDVFTNGLKKGDFGNRGGPRCATGHLRSHTCEENSELFSSHNAFFQAAAIAVADRIPKLCPCKPCQTGGAYNDPAFAFDQIVYWNDSTLTTPEDVREAFLLAAKDLRNG